MNPFARLMAYIARLGRPAMVEENSFFVGNTSAHQDDFQVVLQSGGSVVIGSVPGGFVPMVDPSQFPDDARSRNWEACHLFANGGTLPHRGFGGLHLGEPPLALLCPDCDLKQPAIQHGARRCAYCGTRMQVHGTRLFWWRDTEVTAEPWSPRP